MGIFSGLVMLVVACDKDNGLYISAPWWCVWLLKVIILARSISALGFRATLVCEYP